MCVCVQGALFCLLQQDGCIFVAADEKKRPDDTPSAGLSNKDVLRQEGATVNDLVLPIYIFKL